MRVAGRLSGMPRASAALAIAMICSGCTFAAGQAWQRNECSRIVDADDHRKCLERTRTSEDDYRRDAERARVPR